MRVSLICSVRLRSRVNFYVFFRYFRGNILSLWVFFRLSNLVRAKWISSGLIFIVILFSGSVSSVVAFMGCG